MTRTESIKKQNLLIAQQNINNAMPLSIEANPIIISFTRSAGGKSTQSSELYNLSIKEKIKKLIKSMLEERYNELQKQQDEIKKQNEQSEHKIFNWIKNTIGLNPDLNNIKKQLSNIKKQLKELEEDTADISKIFKDFTGKELDNNALDGLLKSETAKSEADAIFKPVNADYTAADQELDRNVTNGVFKKGLILNSGAKNDPLERTALKKELDTFFADKYQSEKDSLLKNLNENNVDIIKEIIAREKQKDGSLGVDINQLNEIAQSVTAENKDILLQMIKMKDTKGKNIFSVENLKVIVGKITPENKEILTKMLEMKKSDGTQVFNSDNLINIAGKITSENKDILLKILELKNSDETGVLETKKTDGTIFYNSDSFVNMAGKIKPENMEILTRMMGMKTSKEICYFNINNFMNVAGTSQTEQVIEILNSDKISISNKVDLLRNVMDNSALSENYLSDFRKVMNNEPIVKEFKAETPLEEVVKNVPIGEVATVGKKFYVNDNGSLVELKMTKEKYLELFPPIKRYSLNQKQLGDCWFVSTLDDLMNDSAYRAKLYQLFRQDGNDIYIKFPDGKNEIKFPKSKVILSKNGKNVSGALGFQMIEQAFTIHRNNKYTDNPYEDITKFSGNIDEQMEKLRGGSSLEAVQKIFGIQNVKALKPLSNQEESLRSFLKKYAKKEKSGHFVSFSTIQPINIITKESENETQTQTESKLNGDYDIYSHHVYGIVDYDEETDTVSIKNPWHTGLITGVPVSELSKYIKDMREIELKQNVA